MFQPEAGDCAVTRAGQYSKSDYGPVAFLNRRAAGHARQHRLHIVQSRRGLVPPRASNTPVLIRVSRREIEWTAGVCFSLLAVMMLVLSSFFLIFIGNCCVARIIKRLVTHCRKQDTIGVCHFHRHVYEGGVGPQSRQYVP